MSLCTHRFIAIVLIILLLVSHTVYLPYLARGDSLAAGFSPTGTIVYSLDVTGLAKDDARVFWCVREDAWSFYT
ncbi:hypothetical protein Elgi_26200 [Paenibacillus elgii]|uniref:hypothetical protein n=1 Tax=Paenibacillus elgii TaxID=189691 RepID=UPI002D7CCAB1|nr:hypothetical protein Elgi_26200 [Paenibacillus elgii]